MITTSLTPPCVGGGFFDVAVLILSWNQVGTWSAPHGPTRGRVTVDLPVPRSHHIILGRGPTTRSEGVIITSFVFPLHVKALF